MMNGLKGLNETAKKVCNIISLHFTWTSRYNLKMPMYQNQKDFKMLNKMESVESIVNRFNLYKY